MTQQEIFDEVVAALRKQGQASMSENEGCAYRGENGCRCAAGWLIPDDRYSPEIEGHTIANTAVKDALRPEVLKHFHLLRALQRAHDESAVDDGNIRPAAEFMTLLETRLRETADIYGVTYTAPVSP